MGDDVWFALFFLFPVIRTEASRVTFKLHTHTHTTASCGPIDCSDGDAFCGSHHEGSYCKYWEFPQVCSGTNLPCSCGETSTTETSATPLTTSNASGSTTSSSSTTVHSSTTRTVTTTIATTRSPSSSTTTAKSITTTPTSSSTTIITTTNSCGPIDCSDGDDFCSSHYHGSYCKYWALPAVCSGTNIECSCRETPSCSTTSSTASKSATTTSSSATTNPDHSSTTTTSTTSSTTSPTVSSTTKSIPTSSFDCSKGDEVCSLEVPGSYCKYWELPSTCSHSNTLCSCNGQTSPQSTTSSTTTAHSNTGSSSWTSTMSPTTSTDAYTSPARDCHDGDQFCCSHYTGSYCKYWESPPICSGTNLHCSCIA